MSVPPSPITTLSTADSWAFLARQQVGRLVTHVGNEPEIFPVNFVVDGEQIVLRSGEGTKLFAITVNSRVAFEVDSWDAERGTSVVARGWARELESTADIERASALPLQPWVPTTKTHWIAIDVDGISGRSFRFGPEPEPLQPVGDD